MRGLLPLTCLLLLLSIGLPSVAPHGEVLFDFVTSKLEANLGREWDFNLTIDAPIVPQKGSKDADLITSLPGQPKNTTTKHYAGYVTVDDKAGRNLFYYFAEAPAKGAAPIPVKIWINGAPGCSSVGSGAFLEHGPFKVSPGGKGLEVNEYAWNENRVAHMLYLDTPVGTGFSYSDTPADYERYNDLSVAEDNLKFIVNWLERFPEYKNSDIMLAGQGYAASYATQLAQLILNHNKVAKENIIKLNQIVLANPLLNAEVDLFGAYDNLWSHGMLSTKMMENLVEQCNGKTQKRCKNARDAALNAVRPLYLYDLTADVCTTTPPANGNINEVYECVERDVATYLSSPEVQKALHVDPAKAPNTWMQCNSHVTEVYGEFIQNTIPILQNLVNNEIFIFVYSGDADAVIPTISTRQSLKRLKLNQTSEWASWSTSAIEESGFVEIYDWVVFGTVRGAGHVVGKTQPRQLLTLLAYYYNGELEPQKEEDPKPEFESEPAPAPTPMK